MKEKVNMRRAVPVLVIILSTFVLSGIFCYMQKLYPDEIICVMCINIFYVSLMVFELEFDRKRKYISNNTKTTFGRVAVGYLACCIIASCHLLLCHALVYVLYQSCCRLGEVDGVCRC